MALVFDGLPIPARLVGFTPLQVSVETFMMSMPLPDDEEGAFLMSVRCPTRADAFLQVNVEVLTP